MVDWESSLRKYLVKKFKEALGITITEDSITRFEFNTNLDLNELLIEELLTVYAFALMREDFEKAKLVAEEVESRNAKIAFDIDDKNKSGVIKIFFEPDTGKADLEMLMQILPDGVVIDWEKQNF